MEVLRHVSNTAVWGSLAATLLLGAYMWVQAVGDPDRRWRFAVFAAICWSIAASDFFHDRMQLSTYEMLRLFEWTWYAAAVLLLLSYPARWIAATAVGLPTIGLAVWASGHPELAATVAFPLGFGVAAVAHGRHYWRHRGYSSALLCPYSVAMAMLCSIYCAVVSTGNATIIVLGYAHWALLNVCAVAFAWMHLPRELRGRAPVVVNPRHAIPMFVAIVLAEATVCLGLLPFFDWPPTLYLGGSVLLVVATMIPYLHHRHLLVIHTDNVAALLDERTASLVKAKGELATLIETQAERLDQQEREIQAKAEVIQRQRRVELAAQTAGQAAHDIQNLISPILTYVSRLHRVADEAPAVRLIAGKIQAQAEQLLELNSQLLALSRRGRVEAHPINLSELVRDVLDRFPGDAVGIECPGECWIEGSWSQVSRAASNLVRNALDAVHEGGGRVVVRCGSLKPIETRRCHLGFLDPGEYAYLEVEDTGPGIPEAIRERVFEPFFSSKTGSQSSGSGLGLSIVAAVVDDHRGVLDLHTGAEGTRFTLYFPAGRAAGSPEGPRALCGIETVLVTDDDPSILRQYEKILSDAGYDVLTASSGAEAIQLLQAQHIDLILLDLRMPLMSGAETFFAAVNTRPGVRAVVHSSYVDAEQASRLRELGVCAFLQKPASRVEVLRSLRQALDARELPLG
ncbi:MAG: ATP-binding protein [Planctomycetota bacterium]